MPECMVLGKNASNHFTMTSFIPINDIVYIIDLSELVKKREAKHLKELKAKPII